MTLKSKTITPKNSSKNRYLTAGSLAVAIAFVSVYAWIKPLPAPAVPPGVAVGKSTPKPCPSLKKETPENQLGPTKESLPPDDTPLVRQREEVPCEKTPPHMAAHHLERIRELIGKNDLEGFLAYLADHDMDLNTQTDTQSRTRLFELWFPFHREIGNLTLLRTLIDAGAIIDPPDHNTLTALLFTGNPDIFDFMARDYPHVITRHGVDTFKYLALFSNAPLMQRLQEEGVVVSSDTFSPEELEAFEKQCDDPECFAILEEAGIRFEKHAVINAITHGRFQALAHHAKNMDISKLRIDGKNALDIALETPRTDVSVIRFLETQGLVIEPRHLEKANHNLQFDGVMTLDVKSKGFYGSSSFDGFPFAKQVAAYMKRRLETP